MVNSHEVSLIEKRCELQRLLIAKLAALSLFPNDIVRKLVNEEVQRLPVSPKQHNKIKNKKNVIVTDAVRPTTVTGKCEWKQEWVKTTEYMAWQKSLKDGTKPSIIKRRLAQAMVKKNLIRNRLSELVDTSSNDLKSSLSQKKIKKQQFENDGTQLSDKSKLATCSSPTTSSSVASELSDSVLPMTNQSPKTPLKCSATQTEQLPKNTSLVSSEKVERDVKKKLKERKLKAERKAKENDTKDQIEQDGFYFIPHVRSVSPSIRIIPSPNVTIQKEVVKAKAQQFLGANYSASFPSISEGSPSRTRFLKFKKANCDTFEVVASRESLEKRKPVNVGKTAEVKPVDVPKNQVSSDIEVTSKTSKQQDDSSPKFLKPKNAKDTYTVVAGKQSALSVSVTNVPFVKIIQDMVKDGVTTLMIRTSSTADDRLLIGPGFMCTENEFRELYLEKFLSSCDYEPRSTNSRHAHEKNFPLYYDHVKRLATFFCEDPILRMSFCHKIRLRWTTPASTGFKSTEIVTSENVNASKATPQVQTNPWGVTVPAGRICF